MAPERRLRELGEALPDPARAPERVGRGGHPARVVVVERLARPAGEGDRRREADGGDRNGSKASHRFSPAKKKGAGIAPRPLRWDRGTYPLPTDTGRRGRCRPPPER